MAAMIGQLAPDVRLPDADGRTVALVELRGGVVVLVLIRHLA